MRFRRLMAASMAGIMAVSSAIVCQVTAGAEGDIDLSTGSIGSSILAEDEWNPGNLAKPSLSLDSKWGNAASFKGYDKIEVTYTCENLDDVNYVYLIAQSGTVGWIQASSSPKAEGTLTLDLKDYQEKTYEAISVLVEPKSSFVIGNTFDPKITITSAKLVTADTREWTETELSIAGLPTQENNSEVPIELGTDKDLDISKFSSEAKLVVYYTSGSDAGWGNVQVIDNSSEWTPATDALPSKGDGVAASGEIPLSTFDGMTKIVLQNNNDAVITKVTVKDVKSDIAVTDVSLNKTTLTLTEGDTDDTLIATVLPTNATNPAVTWTSNDTSVATVDENGKVKAVAEGTTTVTAKAGDKTATCTVTVNAKTYDITVSSATNGTVTVDKTAAEGDTVTVTATPDTGYELDTITVTAADKTTVEVTNKTFTMPAQAVTVSATFKEITVTGVTLKESTTIIVGGTETLAPDITPDTALNKAVTWKSSDTSVATVDSTGKVTAVKAGTATITATTSNGKTATCTVKVTDQKVDATGITLNKSTTTIEAGKTETLTAVITPDNSTDKAVWTSSDETIAKVENGVVTAIKAGTVKITAKAGSFSAECEVTVTPAVVNVTGVTLNKTTAELKPEETVTLTATVAPADATDKTVTWKSSDEKVATVKDGVVTAVAAGTATITAKAGDKTATCTVTVKAAQTSTDIVLWEGNKELPSGWSENIKIEKDVSGFGAGTIVVEVEPGSGAQMAIKYPTGKWPVVDGLKEYYDVTGTTMKFEVTADAMKKTGSNSIAVSGQNLTVKKVTFVPSQATTDDEETETSYDTLKEEKVSDFNTENGTKALYVKSITKADAAKYSAYEITVTLSNGKSLTKTTNKCFKGFKYENTSGDPVTVKSDDHYFIAVKIINIPADITVDSVTIKPVVD